MRLGQDLIKVLETLQGIFLAASWWPENCWPLSSESFKGMEHKIEKMESSGLVEFVNHEGEKLVRITQKGRDEYKKRKGITW